MGHIIHCFSLDLASGKRLSRFQMLINTLFYGKSAGNKQTKNCLAPAVYVNTAVKTLCMYTLLQSGLSCTSQRHSSVKFNNPHKELEKNNGNTLNSHLSLYGNKFPVLAGHESTELINELYT